MDAWKTEKFIRAYAQTKKFDNKDDTMSNSAENNGEFRCRCTIH